MARMLFISSTTPKAAAVSARLATSRKRGQPTCLHPMADANTSAGRGVDQALGCLLGLAVGDAAGASLEWAPDQAPPAPQVAWEAMHMPGKQLERARLGQGQTTDDTELAICLARGLVGHPPSAGFPVEAVAKQYSFWHSQGAFAGGMTCKIAFSVAEGERKKWIQGVPGASDSPSLATLMMARSQRMSQESKANGALMRVAPLAVWGCRLDPARLAQGAKLDAALSHPNPTCGECSAAYAIALAHLISIARPGCSTAAAGALQAACNWASEHAGAEVQGWLLNDSCLPLEQLDCVPCAGFVRHAFSLAFHFLRLAAHDLAPAPSFESAVHATLCRGGDTDTNAAIVGALMGAHLGAGAIPGWMLRPVLEYEGREDQGGGWPRPVELRAARLPDLARQLYELAVRDTKQSL